MKAVEAPSEAYNQPPTGQLPAKCPRCGCCLDHFLVQHTPTETDLAPPVVPRVANTGSIPEPKVVRPFASDQVKAKQVVPATPRPAPPAKPPAGHPSSAQLRLLDDPRIGGKVTLFLLLAGDRFNLHRRCLQSLVATVPPSRMDLRIVCNQIPATTLNFLKAIPARKLYLDQKKRRRYPAMRAVFWDAALPIETLWTVWLDGTAFIRPGKTDWLNQLAKAILDEDATLGALGRKRCYKIPVSGETDARTWFRGNIAGSRDFRDVRGNPAPNGDHIHFLDSSFFAISTEAIRRGDVPCVKVQETGGDICMGEQLYQAGYRTRAFDVEEQIVVTSTGVPPLVIEQYPWRA